MTLDKLPINAFDVIVLIVLITGILRGRAHGMSEELIKLLEWLAILFGSATCYQWGAQLIGGFTSLLGPLARYLAAYVGVGLLIGLSFTLVQRGFGGKLTGSDVFGRTEYYFGMAAGLLRFGCMLLVVLALLNARAYSPSQVQALEKYQQEAYGSDFFPTLYSVQQTVFVKSVTGSWVRQYLGWLLIKPTAMEDTGFQQKEFSVP
jgi:uncharacterized membrane protein required for colicin V production